MQERTDFLAAALIERAPVAADPERDLEEFLTAQLAASSPEERLTQLEALAERFPVGATAGSTSSSAPDEAARLMMLFLGRDFSQEGVNQEEIIGKFAESLNTLFDSLNRIMAVINQTLLGEQPELATIRKIIGSNIDGNENHVLISEYLERIQNAFLVAHRSFQEASSSLLTEILAELDPETMSRSLSSGLKFGALRKAELFDMIDERFGKMKRWHESGQYRERLLRDFEKRCQQIYK